MNEIVIKTFREGRKTKYGIHYDGEDAPSFVCRSAEDAEAYAEQDIKDAIELDGLSHSVWIRRSYGSDYEYGGTTLNNVNSRTPKWDDTWGLI